MSSRRRATIRTASPSPALMAVDGRVIPVYYWEAFTFAQRFF
jgi:hypothetical protein